MLATFDYRINHYQSDSYPSFEVSDLLCSLTSDDSNPGWEEEAVDEVLVVVMTSGTSRFPVGEGVEGREGEGDSVIGTEEEGREGR